MINPDKTPRTLLIIDDTINNLRVAVDLLDAYGFRILTASDGESGIERAHLAQPDLILLDVRMPGLDGFECCRRLKAHPGTAHIPVIFMTALTDTDNKVRGFELGGVDYVSKPFDAGELLARVRTHLELADLRRGLEQRVEERTAALAAEVAQRKRIQADQSMLLDLLRDQSEQLRALTRQSLADEANTPAAYPSPALAAQIEAVRIVLAQMDNQLQTAETEPDALSADALRRQSLHALSLLKSIADALDRPPLPPAHTNGMARLQEDPLFKLTTREYEVLQLIGQGKSNAEIADILVVSRSTVSSYRSRILTKLGVSDTPALLRYLVERQVGGGEA